MEWRIKVPARVELLGPSQAGKSTLLLKLVGDDSVWERPIKKVVYCAPMLLDRHSYLQELQTKCDDTNKILMTSDTIPAADALRDFGQGAPVMLIVDDILGFSKEQTKGLTDLAVMHSHHLNISLVFCIQNPFIKNTKLDMPTLSRNLTARIVLWQVQDFYIYKLLNSRLFPESKNFLLKCLTKAKTDLMLPYVFINVHPFSGVPRRHICYSAIFEDERRAEGSPVFFDLDQKE